MTLKQHTIQATIGSAVLAPFLGIDAVIFFFSMILIDVDHYFDFVIVCKRFGIRDMFKYHNWLWKRKKSVYAVSILHTVEVFVLLFILGFWSYYFWIVLFGFSIHYVFDIYFLYIHDSTTIRAFSILEYIIKSNGIKCYPVPEREFWNNTN